MKKDFSNKNSISLLKNGPEFIEKNISLVKAAQKFIFFHTYIFEEDEKTKPLLDELIYKAEEGVSVFILIDALGSPSLKISTEIRLKEAGVHFNYFTPFFSFSHWGRRLHQKVLIVDNKSIIVGGINYAKKFNSPDNNLPWLDYACMCEGEIAQDVFRKVYYLYKKSFPEYKDQFSTLLKHKNEVNDHILIQTSVNDWMRYKQEIYRDHIKAIRNSETEIYILATYFIPSKKLLKELRKASLRGVQIHLIFGSESDHPIVDLASDYFYRWYLDNKIKVYEWNKTVIHGKVTLIDNTWSTIGSYNHNYISQYGNIELNLNVYDENFAITLKNEFKNIINESVEITDTTINQTPINRLKVFIVYLLTNAIIIISVMLIYKRKE